MIVLALATSIDALAAGLIFVSFPAKIWQAVAIIAAISFTASMIGVKFGHKFGRKLKINFELIGGIVLVGIGIKILIEHLFF
ncbi:MAG: manganese efflux pump [Paludibacteraceae bacterium]